MRLNLETDRLILRPFESSDAEAMFYGWANDDEVTKYLTWPSHTSIEITKQIIANWLLDYDKPDKINCAIILKENNELIGGIDVVGYEENHVPVIGYDLSRKYWNHGYMTEAFKALLSYLFSLGHQEVRIDAMIENIGSIRVIEKCGGIFLKKEALYRPLKGDTVYINKYVIRNNHGK